MRPTGAWRPSASQMIAPQVAALRRVARVAQALHQRVPCAGDAVGVPAGARGLLREAVARDRRQHEVEGVFSAAAVRSGIGEQAHGVQQLEHRAGPAVRHHERHRVRVMRPHVDEVDVQAVDVCHELRQRIEPRLGLAPIVAGAPVLHERLELRELHALRAVIDGLGLGPARGADAAAQIVERGLRHLRTERSDCVGRRCTRQRPGRGQRGERPGIAQYRTPRHRNYLFSHHRRRASDAPARSSCVHGWAANSARTSSTVRPGLWRCR
jgi:hypothetical protein